MNSKNKIVISGKGSGDPLGAVVTTPSLAACSNSGNQAAVLHVVDHIIVPNSFLVSSRKTLRHEIVSTTSTLQTGRATDL